MSRSSSFSPVVAIALATALLPTSSCRVGPEIPREPPLALPAAFPADGTTNATSTSLHAFADPVLDQLVEQALRDNRDLATSLARLDEAAALAGVADAAALPSLAFAADRQWQYASAQGAGLAGAGVRAGLVPRRQDLHRVGLTASWEIDLFGAVAHRRNAAAAREHAAAATVHGTALRIAAEVAASYLELRHLEERITVAEASAEARHRLYELAVAAHAAGLGDSGTEAAARSAWQQAQALPPRLRGAFTAGERRLAVLLGASPSEFRLPARTAALQVPASFALGVPADLLRRRPDLLAAEAEVAAATAAIGIATADCYPRLFLLGSGGLEAQSFDRLGNRSALQGLGGPSLQLPLFQGGALASAVTAAEANQRAALATFAQRILTALADVEAAFAQHQGERQRLAAAVDAADAAAIAATRASARVRSGLQAEGSALAARLQALAATDERLLAATEASLAAVALWKALGGDLPPSPGAPSPAAIAAQGPTQKAR